MSRTLALVSEIQMHSCFYRCFTTYHNDKILEKEKTVEIRKYNIEGNLQITYIGKIDSLLETCAVVHAQWEHPKRDLGYTIFETGDQFTEYFYKDKWFNIMQINEVTTGDLRGWYCNISYPAIITNDFISYVDLFLDLWIDPQKKITLLDEDEFQCVELDEMIRKQAYEGVAEITQWITHDLGPFSSSHGSRNS
jgi:protein associated with RNAse G/E